MTPIEVLQKVAEGSAVEAFLAKSGEHMVLVQVSRPELSEDAELFGRFLDTSKRSTLFAHPSLLAPTESRIGADGRFLLVSAPVSGWTAFDALKSTGPLSTKEAVRWGRALCDALAFLHQRGLTHGHLSPKNVFLEGHPLEPTVKLLDMGLLLFRAGRSLKTPLNVRLVPAEYLSPERVTGQRASAASDVYGLGVLLHELLTGKPPFHGETDEDTRRAHVGEPVPALPPGLSAWQPFFSLALAKDPEARFASAAKARAAIEGVLANTTSAIPVVQGKAITTPPKPKPQLLILPEPVVQPSSVPEVSDDEIVDIVTSFEGDPQPGDLLGNYKLGACVGEGGMGRVFRATHRSLGRQVAIKVLPAELSKKASLVKRFVQEAQTVNRVKHPNIVEVYDLFHESLPGGDLVYFVMELIEGRSLREVGREKPVALPRALNLVRQAAQALQAAHAVGVVHRDVKPDNIIVAQTDEGEVAKVLDFGVARIRGGTQDGRMTSAGQVVGTPLWMAPEQVMGLDVDQRGDLYALATVLYVLLERRFPFDGGTTQDMVMARLSKTARELSPRTFLGEAVPAELRTLVARCLAREPADRPQSMAEVVEALLRLEAKFALGMLDAGTHPELARALPTPLPTPLPMVVPPPPPARRRWLWPAVALAAITGAAALGLFVVRPAVVPTPEPAVEAAPATAPAPAATLNVVVTSQPPGAAVTRRDTGAPLGFTPVTLELERGQALVIDLTLPNYEPAARAVRPTANGALDVVLTKSKRRRAPVRDGVIDPFAP